jgi:hypothetical protein
MVTMPHASSDPERATDPGKRSKDIAISVEVPSGGFGE